MKKLYRIKEQGKIAGICAGVADAWDLDPTLIRLTAVFLCILTQVFPLVGAYLVGWWLIPEKKDIVGVVSETDTH